MNLPTKKNAKEWLWNQWKSGEAINLRGKVSGDVIFELGDAGKELITGFATNKEKMEFIRFTGACRISGDPEKDL